MLQSIKNKVISHLTKELIQPTRAEAIYECALIGSHFYGGLLYYFHAL